jgi:arabinogalactan oligomer / maltooligosaccharide transport system permease protein
MAAVDTTLPAGGRSDRHGTRTVGLPGQNDVHPHGLRWWRELGWRHVVTWVALAFAFVPILYVVSSSLNPTGSLTGSNHLFSAISVDNYVKLLTDPVHPYLTWFANTLVIATVTSLGTVMLGAAAAYAFSRFRFRGRRGGLLSLLLVQMFPQILAYVAIFLLLVTLKDVFPAIGLGTRLGLILVYLGGALGVNTYLMYGFFNTVPRELDEAAIVDGASHARIFFTMTLRLVMPILVTVFMLVFVGLYSEFMLASIFLTDIEHQTLGVGLYGMTLGNEANTLFGRFTAGALLASIPVMVLYLVFQRQLVGGLTTGSVK